MTMAIVVIVVTSALLAGAAWGLFGALPKRVEGFLIATAGGALIVSVVSELVEPASENAPLLWVMAALMLGAVVFLVLDYFVKQKLGGGGGGLLAAITLDGIPENLALGVALIGATPLQVASLAGSIFLSNLPEAAGGATEMREDGLSKSKAFGLWAAAAAMLAASAIIGNLLLQGAPQEALALIRAFAAGAVVASLGTEVFPQAYREDHLLAGFATAVGFVLAYSLTALG
jgi:zinc transporter, ZIP family